MLVKDRKINRWENFDYANDRYYFVTICVQNKEVVFGQVVDKKMVLNEYGLIVKQQLLWLENNFSYIGLNGFVVMPNHVHVIIEIDRLKKNRGSTIGPVGTGLDLSKTRTALELSLLTQTTQTPTTPTQIKILPLSNIIGAFKTTSSKLIHQKGLINFHWQRSFYDRIIRDEKELNNAQNYILANPYNWEKDRNNMENLLM